MPVESKDKKKTFGIKRMINSIKNSIIGLVIAYKNEQSMLIQLLASILLIVLGIILKINHIEWLFIVGIIGSTCTVELINTALENTVDLVTDKIHPLAKSAKDIASAAEFVLCLMSLIMALIIFIPKII